MSESSRESTSSTPSSIDSSLNEQPPQMVGAIRSDAIPGYRILSELGRGGMGVVYKAQDLRLKRLIALKVILAGGHAGTTDRLRFNLEAETSARLQHPNIVQVYEVGEAEGLPFLAMEYCPNGSLQDTVKDKLTSYKDAARKIAVLARALQFAHQNGIIHRDLKPGNVLIGADGTLKVADFGLAKLIDSEDAVTQTGMILGSMGYMAPEQAEGRTREATPATDVYALGAILYKLLCGKPPFQGANEWETVEQIIKNDAISIQILQPRVPRDLATISHKCLEKEPDRRYTSAEALADDLDRFLADQPIQARPLSTSERIVRWARRHPALMGVIVFSILLLLMVTTSLAWSSHRSSDLMQNIIQVERPLQKISGQIRYLDLALTSSAKLAAATGDLTYEDTYKEEATNLDQVLNSAEPLAPEAILALKAVDTANSALVKMEEEAFALVRGGNRAEAQSLLDSERYQEMKKRYTSGLETFIKKLEQSEKAALDQAQAETRLFQTLAYILLGGLVILFLIGGLVVQRSLRRE